MTDRLAELIAMYEGELPYLEAAHLPNNARRTRDTITALKLVAEARAIHLSSGGRDLDEKCYTKRDVEMLVGVVRALESSKGLPVWLSVEHQK